MSNNIPDFAAELVSMATGRSHDSHHNNVCFCIVEHHSLKLKLRNCSTAMGSTSLSELYEYETKITCFTVYIITYHMTIM